MGKELFDNIPSKVGDLLTDVKNGKIGLPDLQRPFVWSDSKVRNLLDSMLKGYPIGYIMLWESPQDFDNVSHIGLGEKIYKAPRDLVIDGQQRLTALLASMLGIKIKDSEYRERYVKISYNPLSRELDVWNYAHEKDPEWINAISDIFVADNEHTIARMRREYIKGVNDKRKKNEQFILSEDEEISVEENINDLLDLNIYSLPTLKINTKAGEEDVADIFVRVNSGGQKLTEKNFIETLLAVYDNDVHDKINNFCAESRVPKDKTSFNHIMEVDPVHLIRAAVGFAFKRARLRYAYMLMRGKDLKTGVITQEIRTENLGKFKNALDVVMNLNNWHAFMNIVADAGYLNGSLISSNNALIFSYILYLIGKYEYKVNAVDFQKLMRRWIFMVTITGYYTNSPESAMEQQFADLRSIKSDVEFVKYMNMSIEGKFTEDYFTYNLIDDLTTSSTQSPVWFAYIASENVLNFPMLFSTTPVSKYFIVGANGSKSSIDIHHIFPKNYLDSLGINEDRERNQIANFTYLDYTTNIDISDNPPSVYVGNYKTKLGNEGYIKACTENALPKGFENMEYHEFLSKRRILMSEIIRKAYEKLTK
jgi:hypothetical protein